MEQHPVPQNVTTFQFRLVGDMTIKQFGYLAGGIILGYISYKLPLPFFFTWPLAIASGLLGFGLAFVPIEERPLDVWIASFIKNIYNPTQWVWQKEKKPTKETPVIHVPTPPVSEKYVAAGAHTTGSIISMNYSSHLFDWLKSIFPAKSKPDAFTKHAEPPKKPQAPVPPPPPAPPQPVASPPPTHERVVELQGQLSEALSQREKLEKELVAIRQQMERQSKTATTTTRPAGVTPSVSGAPAASVRVIAPGTATKTGFLRLTTFPNVVTGIVKDNYGNLLAGMLITVLDKDDVPLRALKTNKLGQFAASTPLPNNTYIVEIEDPKGGFVFDKIQISLTGAVAPAVEVIAKSQKQVERDKLAKEIFGNQPI